MRSVISHFAMSSQSSDRVPVRPCYQGSTAQATKGWHDLHMASYPLQQPDELKAKETERTRPPLCARQARYKPGTTLQEEGRVHSAGVVCWKRGGGLGGGSCQHAKCCQSRTLDCALSSKSPEDLDELRQWTRTLLLRAILHHTW